MPLLPLLCVADPRVIIVIFHTPGGSKTRRQLRVDSLGGAAHCSHKDKSLHFSATALLSRRPSGAVVLLRLINTRKIDLMTVAQIKLRSANKTGVRCFVCGEYWLNE